MQIYSVLIVDDDQKTRAISEMTLETAFDVYLAEPGADCLMVAECEEPDLILFDVKTPAMNGLTTLIMLRQNPLTASIPVILMSAETEWCGDELLRRRYRKLDTIGFIERTFDPRMAAQIRKLAESR